MIPLPYHQSASGSAEVKTRMTAVSESRLYDSSPDVELLIHVWPRKHEFVKNPLRTKAYPRNRHLLEPFWSFVISSRNIPFFPANFYTVPSFVCVTTSVPAPREERDTERGSDRSYFGPSIYLHVSVQSVYSLSRLVMLTQGGSGLARS